uniref:YadA family autotransporter adhesin n=1 Tax=Psychrobacter lutiphocae TaxID=540500 RepID=UPI0003682EFB
VDSANGNLNLVMAKDLTDIDSITVNNGGPVINKDGIDMGNKTITNLAPGEKPTDAVNVSQLTTQVAASKEVVKSEDKSITVNTTKDDVTGATIFDVAVNTDNKTITKNADGSIKAVTTTLTHDSNGSVNAPTNSDGSVNTNALATADTVATAINSSGFNVASSGNLAEGNEIGAKLINPGATVTYTAGDNLTVKRVGNEFTFATKDDVVFDQVTINNGGPVINADGIDMNNHTITNLAPGKDGKDAVNVDQLTQTVAASKVKVVKGTNIASVDLDEKTNTYTVNADGTTVSEGSDAVSVVKGEKDTTTNLTDYKVDLSQATKDSLANADSALQEVVTQIDGKDVKTIKKDDNTANFVTGTNIKLEDDGEGGIKVSTADDVKFTNVNVTENLTVDGNTTVEGNTTVKGDTNLGDKFFVTNEGATYTGPITEGNHIVNKQYVDDGRTEVEAGNNVTITPTTGDKDQPIYTVDAEKTTVSSETLEVVGTKDDDTDITDYKVELKDSDKDAIANVGKGFNIADGAGHNDNVQLGQTVIYKGTDGNIVTDVTDNQVGFKLANVVNIGGNNPITINGDTNTITGLGPNLPTDGTPAPGNINKSSAATVGDVLNAGFNLQQAGTQKDFVQAYDNVNFTNGNATTVDINSDGKTSNIKYDVNVDGSTIKIVGGKLVAVGGTGGTGGKVETTDLTVTGGKVDTPKAGEGDKVVTADNLADTINNSGFTVKATNDAVTDDAGEMVNPGDEVNFISGDNINVTRDGTNITVATKGDVKFDNVTAGNINAGNMNVENVGDGPNSVTNKGYVDNGRTKVTSKDESIIVNAKPKGDGNGFIYDLSVDTSKINAEAAKHTSVSGEGPITVTKSDTPNDKGGDNYVVSVETDSTINTEGGKLSVNTGNINTAPNGTASASKPGSIATTGNVAEAINKSGFTVKANGDEGEMVNPGDTVDFINGKNIEITRDGTNLTVATKAEVEFDKVNVGNTSVDSNGITITNPDLPDNTVTLTNQGLNNGGNTITNVGPGVNGTDAVNLNQLKDLGYNLNTKIKKVGDEANAGISSAMAMAALPQAYLPGKSMLTGGMASYNGEAAVAVGLSKLSDNGRWVFKISGSADTEGNAGGAVGAGFHF